MAKASERIFWLICAVILGAILVTTFWTKSAGVVVTGHRWERGIEIEAYQPVDEGSWCDQVPTEAYDTRQEQRQRGTKEVSYPNKICISIIMKTFQKLLKNSRNQYLAYMYHC